MKLNLVSRISMGDIANTGLQARCWWASRNTLQGRKRCLHLTQSSYYPQRAKHIRGAQGDKWLLLPKAQLKTELQHTQRLLQGTPE